jgi:hypothetical protein
MKRRSGHLPAARRLAEIAADAEEIFRVPV